MDRNNQMPDRLDAATWRQRAAAHAERAERLTAGRIARRAAGINDPIEDFLFTYYPIKPARLRAWHPGSGVILEDARGEEIPRWYAASGDADLIVDAAALLDARGPLLGFIHRLLRGTRERPAQYGCFGLHEWAMVYKLDPERVRHESTPLRLTPAETDAVVERHNIACSHFDAFRFFTPEASGLNRLSPTRENQPLLEQRGCLHAGMDLYKWASKLGPALPGELLLDCFELAREIRILDMRASPYDIGAWGYSAVPIETDAGKAEYVAAQRAFTTRSDILRDRVLDALLRTREAASA
ncbi:3-methyladenine DNA glycosylase [Mycetocola spongiae]|uniref:3-methyladenine DNA glycosylase n=1 Tax=Mycetocola spongiae TaxID=2859226 RepID=UPI00299DB841|nr:3-methyladenine DNA glycosylase [Mycetocola spongiae]